MPDVAQLNGELRNFRVFGLDETLSNGLEALFEVTQRQWDAATVPNDEFLAPTGRVMDTIDRLPQTGNKGIYLKQQLSDKLIEHKQYTDKYGEDLPEIRHWKWGAPNAGKAA